MDKIVLKTLQKVRPIPFKTTKHKDVTERLERINPKLANDARKVLEVNKSERHIRGGLATKEKYLTMSGVKSIKAL